MSRWRPASATQNYTEIVSGLQEGDIIGYVSSSTFSYDDYSTSTDAATGSILIAGVVNPVPALGGRK